MKSIFLAVFMLAAAYTPGRAAPIWNCGGAKKPEATSPCAAPKIVQLDNAIDARLGRLLATADPVTAMLLRRDQRWFLDTLTDEKPSRMELQDETQRESLGAKLAARLKTLEAMQSRAGGLPGEWANALLAVTVTKADGEALQVEIAGKVAYPELVEPAECHVKATVKPDAGGWYSGTATPAEAEKAAEPNQKPPVLRMRTQAATLRVVFSSGESSDFCTSPGFITGSYFAMRPSPPAATPQTVTPSFDCATAKNEDEEEICSDPELAQKDAEVAKIYGPALKRLDAKAQAHLRDDQRGWSKIKNESFQFFLHPYWDKRAAMVHHTDSARDELLQSLTARADMLRDLDETRTGFAGRWIGYNASLTIAPKKDATDGTLTASGGKWDANDYKANCDFAADGKVAGGKFETEGGSPRFTRDGISLMVDAHYPDKTRTKDMELKMERPEYCNRFDSAKARLFPVKDDVANSRRR